jgi:hypothetical protein
VDNRPRAGDGRGTDGVRVTAPAGPDIGPVPTPSTIPTGLAHRASPVRTPTPGPGTRSVWTDVHTVHTPMTKGDE